MKSTATLSSARSTSRIVAQCQSCGCRNLRSALFVGYMPPVNQMRPMGVQLDEQPTYPAEVFMCPECSLVQLGLVVDPTILFGPDYPYTSGTTKLLHTNFDDLAEESAEILNRTNPDLIVDIGSNDGTLLSKFKNRGFRVLGIEPTNAGEIAKAAGIPTETKFFSEATGKDVSVRHGKAALATCANCFAHIDDVHGVIRGVLALLGGNGVFVNESHYLVPLLDNLQYDTIYHEHLRYYSLTAQKSLFERHGLEIIHARRIPSHGGSIRVYVSPKGRRSVLPTVEKILAEELSRGPWEVQLAEFRQRVVASKLKLYILLARLQEAGKRIVGIGAPSRASTMITYVGLNEQIIEAVGEVPGSRKIGRYMPGTLIPVRDEAELLGSQPDVAFIFSWHIAAELMPKLRQRGFKGQFLIPLPEPRLV
jgi:hypothetical protein